MSRSFPVGQNARRDHRVHDIRPIVVLLTDFGHHDPYVGQMKGVILRHAPDAALIDLCHEIRTHDTRQAAFMLEASYVHFPDAAIFVCVVDPGVGTERGLLLAQWRERWFLAPDNGLLNFIPRTASWWQLPAPPTEASRTFHGRDILAPLAARLARGEHPDTLGVGFHPNHAATSPADQMARIETDTIRCRVVHVDRFGNCLLNLPIQPVHATWRLGQGRNVDHAQTYADIAPDRIGVMAGSQGVMELAMNQTSCARHLGLGPGDKVTLIRHASSEPT